MTENPGPSQSPGTPGAPRRIRAGDTDRDRVVAALQGHREAGRLTPDEFEERMEAALRAVYLDELPGLLADLPATATVARDSPTTTSRGTTTTTTTTRTPIRTGTGRSPRWPPAWRWSW